MQAKAKIKNARVSFKSSIIVCKYIRGLKLERAKKFLENLINQKFSINGKYYTKVAKQLLDLLNQAEANALRKNLKIEKLYVFAKADKGEKIMRYGRMGARKAKSTNLEIILVEK